MRRALAASLATLVACAAAPARLNTTSPRSPPVSYDVHVHVGSPAQYGTDAPTQAAVAAMLDRAHVARAVLLSSGYRFHDLAAARAENDYVAMLVHADTRYIGFCGVHPLESWALDELTRCRSIGLRGVKLHVNEQALDLSRPEVLSAVGLVLERAGVEHMIVTIHADAGSRPLTRMLARYPGTTVILAHALWHAWRDLVYVSAQRMASRRGGGHALENVYVDISGLLPFYVDSPNREEIMWQLRTFGIDHVLFGSDYPVSTPEETLRAMDRYPFTDDERARILERNAAALFDGPREPSQAPAEASTRSSAAP